MQRSRFAVILAVLAAAIGRSAAPLPAAAAGTDPKIAIVTSLGTIDVVLDARHAPITARNFLHRVDTKFFDGGSFFRAIPGFVIQGGNKDRETPADTTIPLESGLKTGLKNVDGAISMARTSDPNSATTEFFLCDGDQPSLDASMTSPGYAAFGHVTQNMDLVRRIARLPAQGQLLLEPIKIVRIRRIP
jgi:peptidyl-prolyl cis-trans isomerase A (cyclophilin A)